MYRFVWKIKLNEPDKEKEFIDHWREGSKIIQEYPGALGTHLHRVRGELGSFFAVAEWESQAARDFMQTDINSGKSERSKRWQKLPTNESFGSDHIVFAGEEFRAVLPENP